VINLKDKHVLLGVCGGIAAYKTPELVRRIVKSGCEVKCIITENAKHFVTPLTLRTVSKNKVYEDMFDKDEFDVEHIALSKWADVFVVAPATADVMARLASGRAEDLLSSVMLSTTSRVLLCPSMNENMWKHPATKINLTVLRTYGYNFVMPEKGELACGDTGEGRLAGIEKIFEQISLLLK
jgi:phosphopantothenoylcysteine decarboxylase/phosphopantothenate--cysteine ligase